MFLLFSGIGRYSLCVASLQAAFVIDQYLRGTGHVVYGLFFVARSLGFVPSVGGCFGVEIHAYQQFMVTDLDATSVGNLLISCTTAVVVVFLFSTAF